MERRIEWVGFRRTLSLVIAAALVLALLLVIERPSAAGAQAQTSVTQQARQASVVDAATAARAVTVVNALPAQIPPTIIARVCAALLRALASISRLGPLGVFLVAILSRVLAILGCKAISGA